MPVTPGSRPRRPALRAFHRPRVWLAVWAFGWVLCVVLSLVSPVAIDAPSGSDKFGHLLAYFVLTAWAVQLFATGDTSDSTTQSTQPNAHTASQTRGRWKARSAVLRGRDPGVTGITAAASGRRRRTPVPCRRRAGTPSPGTARPSRRAA